MPAPEESENWDLYWCDVSQLRGLLDVSSHRLSKTQFVPHFRNHYELSTKSQLPRNLKRFKNLLMKEGKTYEARACDCVPTTFEIPSEYHMFMEEYRKHPGSLWIVKPATGSRGRGIFIFKKQKSLTDWRNQKAKEAEGSIQEMETWVVQTYIDDPYLIAGRKFDLRIFVLVTSFSPLKAWMARDGFARLCGSRFTKSELENAMIHLTNMSIQLHNADDSVQGCKWHIRNLREFLMARHGFEKIENLMQQIGEIVVISLRSVQCIMMHHPQCFELYGYDILLQSDLKPWLLEVNAQPSMWATNAEDYTLKNNLISDVLNVVDIEGKLLGTETRVGGFDLFWNDGPVFAPYPAFRKNDCKDAKKRLNIFLGCKNDRIEQMGMLGNWKKHLSANKQ